MNIQVKKKADLEVALGKDLTKTVWGLRNAQWKRCPSSLSFTDVKPAFYLNDGGTLRAYGVDLQTGKITGERYCGSADTAIHHPEQFNETATSPDNHALMFIETYWNGKNTSWSITLVSPNLQKQIGE